MGIKLIVQTGAGSQDFVFDKTPIVIGRKDDCDIVLDDAKVSRNHSLIYNEQGSYYIKDMGSRNGIQVNNQVVSESPLHVDDRIKIGGNLITVNALGASAALLPDEGFTIIKKMSEDESSGTDADAPTDNQLKLQLLYDLLDTIDISMDMQHTLAQFIDYIIERFKPSSCLILQVQNGVISEQAHGGLQCREFSRSIVNHVIREKAGIFSTDVGHDSRLKPGKSIIQMNIRSVICTPMIWKDEVIGALYIDYRDITDSFKAIDLKLLMTLSKYLAAVIMNEKILVRQVQETRRRENLQRFLSPDIARMVSEKESAVHLGGQVQEVSVLFSDIRGFTAMSEEIEPEVMAGLLNEYFTAMVEIVFKHSGTVDKYVGDAVMAVFGSPVAVADKELKAWRTAVEMIKILHGLNRAWQKRGYHTLKIGIGIATGRVFSGNLGSLNKMEFTCIGDSVNLASRLSGASSAFEIMIDELTWRRINKRVRNFKKSSLSVKGKKNDLNIYSKLIAK